MSGVSVRVSMSITAHSEFQTFSSWAYDGWAFYFYFVFFPLGYSPDCFLIWEEVNLEERT